MIRITLNLLLVCIINLNTSLMAHYSYVMIPHVPQRTFTGETRETGSPAFGRHHTPARSLLSHYSTIQIQTTGTPGTPGTPGTLVPEAYQIHLCHTTCNTATQNLPISFLSFSHDNPHLTASHLYAVHGFLDCNFYLLSSLLAPYTVAVACCGNSHQVRRGELLKIDW